MKDSISLVGTGKMALAIAEALKDSFSIEIVGRNYEKLSTLKEVGFKAVTFEEFDPENKIVILAVKPGALESVAEKMEKKCHLLISVMAGVTLQQLKSRIKSRMYVRAMPNLAAIFKSSMTALTGDEEAKFESIKIFEKIGELIWLESERELDIATAIAGSGPAFLALVAEALTDAGVKEGLKREQARKLVEGLFEGSAKLLKKRHPALLKEEVMSPAGTTAAGIEALEKCGVRAAMFMAVKEAFAKTQK